jgi:hypothetical protein
MKPPDKQPPLKEEAEPKLSRQEEALRIIEEYGEACRRSSGS